MGLRVEFDLGTFRLYIAHRAVPREQPRLDFLLPRERGSSAHHSGARGGWEPFCGRICVKGGRGGVKREGTVLCLCPLSCLECPSPLLPIPGSASPQPLLSPAPSSLIASSSL